MAERASLDHVGLVGRDMESMVAAFRRLGFSPTPPRPLMGRDPATGQTVPLQQSSAHLVFLSGYVELSAVHTDSPDHHLAAYLGRHAGLHILALGTEEIGAARALCEASGLHARPVAEASRDIAYGDRHGEARFEWFMLEPESSPEGLVCLVRQVTPELVFQPAVQSHPNGACALAGLYVVTDSPAGAARRMAAATGGILSGEDGAVRVELAAGWIEYLGAARFVERFPQARLPGCPAFAGFAVRVADLAAARARVAASGVAVHPSPSGFWVAPGDAAGSLVEFTGPAARGPAART